MKYFVAAISVLVFVFGLGFCYFAFIAKPSEPDLFSSDKVIVHSPAMGALVESPIEVVGKARGFWFFEASFPIKILDSERNELGVYYAQADGEWMTEDFVPFRGIIKFKTPSTPTGFLILQKDNPSGLPQHDDYVEIPVRFE